MKLDYTKEWFERSAEIEGESSVGAGCQQEPCSVSLALDPPICSNCGHRAQFSHFDDVGDPHWGCDECGRRLTRMAIKTMGGNVWRRLVRTARKFGRKVERCGKCGGPTGDIGGAPGQCKSNDCDGNSNP